MIGELLKLATVLVAEEIRRALKARAKRIAEQAAFANGPPATAVQCDRCGAKVPASDAFMAAHLRACKGAA